MLMTRIVTATAIFNMMMVTAVVDGTTTISQSTGFKKRSKLPWHHLKIDLELKTP
jgi:hypothetical protein